MRRKVLLYTGVLVLSAVLGLGTVAVNQAESIGALESEKAQLEQAVVDQTKALMDFKAEAERSNQLVIDAERERRAVRERSVAARHQMIEALEDESCTDVDLPGAVIERLRENTSGEHSADQDHTARDPP